MDIKKIAAVLAAVMCIGLAGCSDKTNDEEVTTSAEATTETTTEAPITEAPQDDTDGAGESEGEDMGESTNPLQHIADAGLAVGEWPALWEVNDAAILEDFFLLDGSNENYRNMIVLQCPMSANMTELIIIEANDVEAAKADLEARQKKAREQDAWYPDDVERAGASIVGTEGDYAYFILCGNPDEVEKALTDYIKSL
ncbi:MAG: DUF4358 domain-containing protein [Oscillospiraceae bacterium]|nr:DUF4358 domain-containing protein [Oscillospiraceae bacterium]